MELRQLRYFVAIAESGSLMKASERLYVAQPSLSVHLANIEAELGVQLVLRSNRGIELTEDGQLLYERAIVMLRYHRELMRSLKERNALPHGAVSLGIPSGSSGEFTAEIYRAAREELPEVNLYIAEASTAVLYEWLHAGRIDFAVLFSLPENAGLELSPLFMEEYVLISRPVPGIDATDIDFDAVCELQLVLPCRATVWRKILEDMAAKRGKILNVTLETDSFNVAKSITLSSDVHSIMPRSALTEDIARRTILARRLVNPEMRGLLSLASLPATELGRAQRAIRDIVVRVAGEISDRLTAPPAATAPNNPLIRLVPSNVLPVHRRSAQSR